jgi:PAS domain S-box-containing protein
MRDMHRRLFDSLDLGIVWYDAALRIVDANRVARRVLGLGEGAIDSRSDDVGWLQFDQRGEPLPPERRPAWRALHGQVAKASAVVIVDTPLRGRRRLRVNAVAVEALEAGDGGPGVVASFTDITEQHEALRSLRESEQLLRMFGDHAVDVMWIVDPHEQELLYVNAAYERIFGRPRERLYEDLSRWLDGVAPEDFERVAHAAEVLTEAGTYEVEYRMTRPDGRQRWIRGRGFPLYAPDGRMRYMAGFAEDVTPAREAEEALARLHAELEQRVAERTAELEAKHREMESFAYSVSHDLKAPLRTIEGYSRLLESEHGRGLGPEGRTFVEMIRKGAAQMGELIDDLLSYSRLERGRPALGPLAPARLIEELLASQREGIEKSNATLHVEVDPALEVCGEREGLALALRNLLDNALKFSAGSPRPVIEVGCRRDGAHGVLWVRDDGPGFDMRHHDRIFEIFQRLHRSEDYPGTGVGLAMVRKAVERMRGRIWARSAPGQGATFCIELPLAEEVGRRP